MPKLKPTHISPTSDEDDAINAGIAKPTPTLRNWMRNGSHEPSLPLK